MLKVKEAAKELKVSISWLDKMIGQGLIKVVWFGGVRRIPEDEIARIKKDGIKIS